MENVDQLLKSINLTKQITLEDIPNIDLYMDQVIQLFDNKLSSDDEKVLTKTMINNYAKSGLLVPIKNKKYTKEHIILLSLIYQLKGSLKINEIKQLLEKLNDQILEEKFDLKNFYSFYLDLMNLNAAHFSKNLQKHVDEAKEISVDLNNEYLEKVLLVTSLTQMSNFYRTAAEKLVSEIASDDEKK